VKFKCKFSVCSKLFLVISKWVVYKKIRDLKLIFVKVLTLLECTKLMVEYCFLFIVKIWRIYIDLLLACLISLGLMTILIWTPELVIVGCVVLVKLSLLLWGYSVDCLLEENVCRNRHKKNRYWNLVRKLNPSRYTEKFGSMLLHIVSYCIVS
jgi:hypothetical protein